MTTVTLYEKEKIIKIEGHARERHVCYAISGVTAVIFGHLSETISAEIEEDDAFFQISPPASPHIKWGVVEIFLYRDYIDCLWNGLKAIEEEYPGNIVFERI